MPGMLGSNGFRIQEVRADARGFTVVSRGIGWTAPSLQEDWLPDLNDPATLGCILRLIEDAWGLPVGMWYPKAGGCGIALGGLPVVSGRIFIAPTKAEAFLKALQAAPEVKNEL